MTSSYGDQPTHEITSAFAALLTTLSALYTALPALTIVHVHASPYRADHPAKLQQVTGYDTSELAGLLAWADAIGATTATITTREHLDDTGAGSGWLHLAVTGAIDDHTVEVWDRVEALTDSRLPAGAIVLVDDLRTAHTDAARGAYHGNVAHALAAVPHRCTYCGHDATSHALRADQQRGGCYACPDSRESGRVCDSYRPRVTS